MFRIFSSISNIRLKNELFCEIRRNFGKNISGFASLNGSSSFAPSPAVGTSGAVRWLRTSCLSRKAEDRKTMMRSVSAKDEGVDGEGAFDLDSAMKAPASMFPDANTPNLLFDGVRFADLPICHIIVSPNNTIMSLVDTKGKLITYRSCGMEGFKNAKKGTNIAAQATAVTFSLKAVELGIKNVRVRVGGLGPGRMASIKGLQMGGMNIVSISDCTRISWNGPRPKKQRRI